MESICGTENNTLQQSCKLDSRLPILHPVVLGEPDTRISLDTETTSASSSDSDSESECGNQVQPVFNRNNSVLPQGTNIHVENSSDVVFGPVTHFEGPVTIYQTINSNTQNHNGAIENRKPDNNPNKPEKIIRPEKITEEKLTETKKIQIVIFKLVLSLFSMLVVIGAIVSISLSVNNSRPYEPFNEWEDNATVVPFNTSFRIFTRKDWHATPTNFTSPLSHPTEYVVISHTGGSFCRDFLSCYAIVKNIQSYHMQQLKRPDIGYNFLLGGDGSVYVGRDWDTINYHHDKCIEISMIGDYSVKDTINQKMISALEKLLEIGLQLNKLAGNYKLVCHNQITATISPGKNVCDEVAKLRHYYPGWVTF